MTLIHKRKWKERSIPARIGKGRMFWFPGTGNASGQPAIKPVDFVRLNTLNTGTGVVNYNANWNIGPGLNDNTIVRVPDFIKVQS